MLDPKTLEEIPNASRTQFSVARHFGGCNINGVPYVYDPTRDVLIRADVLMSRNKEPRKPKQGGEVH